MAEIKYPKKINSFLLPVLSENLPPKSLKILESPSLNPLIKPTKNPPPPKDKIKKGRIVVTISDPISLNILEKPSLTTFFESSFFMSKRRRWRL